MKKFFASLLFIGILLSSFYIYGAENEALLVDKLAGANGFTMTFEQSGKPPALFFVYAFQGEGATGVAFTYGKTRGGLSDLLHRQASMAQAADAIPAGGERLRRSVSLL